MPSTPVLSLPYPAPSASADVPRDVKALAESLDATAGIVPIGALMLWATGVAPLNWLICDGTPIPAGYPKLIALLGPNTPDLKGRVPIGRDPAQGEFDVIGEASGEKTVKLKAAESGERGHTHTHTLSRALISTGTESADHSHQPAVVSHNFLTIVDGVGDLGFGTAASGGGIAVATVPRLTDDVGSQAFTGGRSAAHYHNVPAQNLSGAITAVGAVDAASAHNNLPPYLILNYIIRAG